jgi:hypothetical protein
MPGWHIQILNGGKCRCLHEIVNKLADQLAQPEELTMLSDATNMLFSTWVAIVFCFIVFCLFDMWRVWPALVRWVTQWPNLSMAWTIFYLKAALFFHVLANPRGTKKK